MIPQRYYFVSFRKSFSIDYSRKMSYLLVGLRVFAETILFKIFNHTMMNKCNLFCFNFEMHAFPITHMRYACILSTGPRCILTWTMSLWSSYWIPIGEWKVLMLICVSGNPHVLRTLRNHRNDRCRLQLLSWMDHAPYSTIMIAIAIANTIQPSHTIAYMYKVAAIEPHLHPCP